MSVFQKTIMLILKIKDIVKIRIFSKKITLISKNKRFY